MTIFSLAFQLAYTLNEFIIFCSSRVTKRFFNYCYGLAPQVTSYRRVIFDFEALAFLAIFTVLFSFNEARNSFMAPKLGSNSARGSSKKSPKPTKQEYGVCGLFSLPF